MVKNFPVLKVPNETMNFLKKIPVNRLRVRVQDEEQIDLQDVVPLIEKYFKDNNLRYIEMISQEIKKNVR
jgi:hypothetical protein